MCRHALCDPAAGGSSANPNNAAGDAPCRWQLHLDDGTCATDADVSSALDDLRVALQQQRQQQQGAQQQDTAQQRGPQRGAAPAAGVGLVGEELGARASAAPAAAQLLQWRVELAVLELCWHWAQRGQALLVAEVRERAMGRACGDSLALYGMQECRVWGRGQGAATARQWLPW